MTNLLKTLPLLLLPLSTQAETNLHINGLSLHLGAENRSELCETNPGLGLGTEINSDWKFLTGGFKNSYCETSYYAGVQTSHRFARYASLTVQIIIASGYPQGPQVAPAPGLLLGPRRAPIHLLFLPTTSGEVTIGIQQTITLEF